MSWGGIWSGRTHLKVKGGLERGQLRCRRRFEALRSRSDQADGRCGPSTHTEPGVSRSRSSRTRRTSRHRCRHGYIAVIVCSIFQDCRVVIREGKMIRLREGSRRGNIRVWDSVLCELVMTRSGNMCVCYRLRSIETRGVGRCRTFNSKRSR